MLEILRPDMPLIMPVRVVIQRHPQRDDRQRGAQQLIQPLQRRRAESLLWIDSFPSPALHGFECEKQKYRRQRQVKHHVPTVDNACREILHVRSMEMCCTR